MPLLFIPPTWAETEQMLRSWAMAMKDLELRLILPGMPTWSERRLPRILLSPRALPPTSRLLLQTQQRVYSFLGLIPRKLGPHRSEEHTSELQSLTNLVCRL